MVDLNVRSATEIMGWKRATRYFKTGSDLYYTTDGSEYILDEHKTPKKYKKWEYKITHWVTFNPHSGVLKEAPTQYFSPTTNSDHLDMLTDKYRKTNIIEIEHFYWGFYVRVKKPNKEWSEVSESHNRATAVIEACLQAIEEAKGVTE